MSPRRWGSSPARKPVKPPSDRGIKVVRVISEGMTERDYFAALDAEFGDACPALKRDPSSGVYALLESLGPRFMAAIGLD